jgi:hypothetical protein
MDTIDGLAKTTRAVLLPERWCAIGYAAGRREVFRVWGSTIPDELVLSPDWLATDDPEALLGGDRAWMVDFDAAVAKGMAIEVTQAQIAPPPPNLPFLQFNLATGTLERLVVVGFEWTKSAADSAAGFTDLLAAHRDSSGLGFAALGTPTNNTEVAPAGYSQSDQRLPAPPSGASPEDRDALELLHWAFGLAPDALPADNIDNPHLTDQRTGLHMMNVLWRGTFDYLTQMWNPWVAGDPILGPSMLYALRRYVVSTCVQPARCRSSALTSSPTRCCRSSASALPIRAVPQSSPGSARCWVCCARCGNWQARTFRCSRTATSTRRRTSCRPAHGRRRRTTATRTTRPSAWNPRRSPTCSRAAESLSSRACCRRWVRTTPGM